MEGGEVMNGILFDVPVPSTLEQVLWMGIGITVARAFGKRCDYEIQRTDWFKGVSRLQRWFLKAGLDALHHWWMGLLLVVYADVIAGWVPIPQTIMYWLGVGVFVDDMPDLPSRIKDYFSYLVTT